MTTGRWWVREKWDVIYMSREVLMDILGRTYQEDDMPAIYGGHSDITTPANVFLFAPFKHECSRQEIN
jgi:hypothetical protein